MSFLGAKKKWNYFSSGWTIGFPNTVKTVKPYWLLSLEISAMIDSSITGIAGLSHIIMTIAIS